MSIFGWVTLLLASIFALLAPALVRRWGAQYSIGG